MLGPGICAFTSTVILFANLRTAMRGRSTWIGWAAVAFAGLEVAAVACLVARGLYVEWDVIW